MNYYNEHDPVAAAWLRELIKAGEIPAGVVDERSIEDVTPAELMGYTQCHFFAGIGGWSLALRLAGVPDSVRLWTGSCPCQPFSSAGEGAGFADERNLWPAFQWLIQQCRPAVVLGEQVASKAVDVWIDLVLADLEAMGYAGWATAFPAAGVGAPHIRDRSYWLGYTDDARPQGHAGDGGAAGREGSGRSASTAGVSGGMADTGCERREVALLHAGECGSQAGQREADERGGCGASRGLADLHSDRRGARREVRPVRQELHLEHGCATSGLADSASIGRREEHAHGRGLVVGDCSQGLPTGSVHGGSDMRPSPVNGHWRAADWLACRDGKWRPVEPGTFPLAHGLPARVGRLRGYGNAIVPQAAAEFLKASLL